MRATRRRLLELAKPLGLSGLSKLTKEAIARRVEQALRAVIRATPEPAARAEPDADAPHKFDLGFPREREIEPPTVPWGYGHDRLTAMVVDPERMYVYWEVTDAAIERARAGLGPARDAAWLNLRLYDVTGRLFDGTNAHSYFDHKVERSDRQWFFDLGKPGSTACVELGMKSSEGYFVRIVRSSRADFPRREPQPPGSVEWLTVKEATGAVEEVGHGTGYGPGATSAPMPPAQDLGSTVTGGEHLVSHHRFAGHWDWRELTRGEWLDEGRVFEWIGPVIRTTWEAGPFEFPVESPVYVEERHDDTALTVLRNGALQVVYGPWQVVIRGIDGRSVRRIVAVWEMRHSWVTAAGVEFRGMGALEAHFPGASEGPALGASERRWLVSSAEILGGASEVYRIGASELRYRGASESFFVAASEWLYGGASEQRLGGASEERRASERRAPGASERHFATVREPVKPPHGTKE